MTTWEHKPRTHQQNSQQSKHRNINGKTKQNKKQWQQQFQQQTLGMEETSNNSSHLSVFVCFEEITSVGNQSRDRQK